MNFINFHLFYYTTSFTVTNASYLRIISKFLYLRQVPFHDFLGEKWLKIYKKKDARNFIFQLNNKYALSIFKRTLSSDDNQSKF